MFIINLEQLLSFISFKGNLQTTKKIYTFLFEGLSLLNKKDQKKEKKS